MPIRKPTKYPKLPVSTRHITEHQSRQSSTAQNFLKLEVRSKSGQEKNAKHHTTKHKRRSTPILKSDVLHESISMRPSIFQGSSCQALSRKNADRTQKSSREGTNKVWPAKYNQPNRQIRHHKEQIIQLSISQQMSCTLLAKEIRWQFWKLIILRF